MNTRISILLLAFGLFANSLHAAGTNFFSNYPNNGSPQGTDLFILEHPSGGTFNLQVQQVPGALGLGSAAFTASSAYDAAGAATAATNGLGLASGLSGMRATNTFDAAGSATAVTNGFPWGALYDAAGAGITAATAATNGLSLASGLAAFRNTNSFDASGAATASTNGYPWGILYDVVGAATAATNGFPWGTLYVTPIESRPSTNSSTAGITVTNLGDGANTNLVYSDKNGRVHRGAIGSGLSWNPATETLSSTGGGGGSGTVTSADVAQNGFTSSGAITTSGTITLTRTADVNNQNFGQTNLSKIGLDQWVVTTNATTHAIIWTNTTYGGWASLTTNGIYSVNGTPFLSSFGLGAGQFPYTDSNTNIVGSTNNTEFEIVAAPTSNATNYTLDFNGPHRVDILTANTNVNLSFLNSATNRSLDLYVDATTSTVPCTITLPAHTRFNHFGSLSVSNTTSSYFHFEFKYGVNSTNAVVTGGDYYQIQ